MLNNTILKTLLKRSVFTLFLSVLSLSVQAAAHMSVEADEGARGCPTTIRNAQTALDTCLQTAPPGDVDLYKALIASHQSQEPEVDEIIFSNADFPKPVHSISFVSLELKRAQAALKNAEGFAAVAAERAAVRAGQIRAETPNSGDISVKGCQGCLRTAQASLNTRRTRFSSPEEVAIYDGAVAFLQTRNDGMDSDLLISSEKRFPQSVRSIAELTVNVKRARLGIAVPPAGLPTKASKEDTAAARGWCWGCCYRD